MTTKPACKCDDKEDASYQCKCPAAPTLTDPLQLYSLYEVVNSEGSGPEAILNCKCIDVSHDKPIDFLCDFSHVKGHGNENDAVSMKEARGKKGAFSEGWEHDQELKIQRSYTMKANKSGGPDVGGQDFAADLSDLENMHEAGILHCLRMRFTCGDLSPDAEKVESKYTAFIGNICIAVNPFAPWPYAGSTAWVQYDKKNNPDCKSYNMQHYIDAKPDVASNRDLEPHCWSVADLAYVTLKKSGKNQAVLICGESGAGKTECCKFVLNYLMDKEGSSIPNLTDKLISTNEPLECFGNAKTQNNDNSSRFAKCMQIAFDKAGQVIGAEIQTSLLEKARVCAIMPNERGFHIFFMVCHYRYGEENNVTGDGKQDVDTSDALDMLGDMAHKHCKSVREFEFTKAAADVNGADGNWPAHDISEFKKVMHSFRNALGYPKEQTDGMMALLVGIMWLGEIDFEGEEKAQVKNMDALQIAADLWGLDCEGMAKALVTYEKDMAGSIIVKEQNESQAKSARDSICKSAFERTFADIVEHCNHSVCGDTGKPNQKGRIGVLDIFGFERMALNSLEQLCINYTNEKLHQTFINEVFQAEIGLYVNEGLSADAIKFTDNAAVLECVSGFNPHKPATTAASAEVKRSIFGHMDKITLQTMKAQSKVPGFMTKILDDCGIPEVKKTDPAYRAKPWEGFKKKGGGWKHSYDDNGDLMQYDRSWMLEDGSGNPSKFAVVHFAGPVVYTAYAVVKNAKMNKKTGVPEFECVPDEEKEKRGIIDSFITKNADKIESTVRDFFFGPSTNEFYSRLNGKTAAGQTVVGKGVGGGTAQDASAKTTTASKFCTEINNFFESLLGKGKTAVSPTFIRAINPRPKGIGAPNTMGERYNLQRVLNQLRYTGILDTVRVRASGYIVRKKFSVFAAEYLFPCNLLPDGCALQGTMLDEDFAASLEADQAKAWAVIETMFKMPEYGIGEAGPVTWLKGKTMVFVKTTAVLALMDKKKEEMMKEVAIIERGRVNMIAGSIRHLRNTPLQRKIDAVNVMKKYAFKMDAPANGVAYFTYKKWSEAASDIRMLGKRKAISVSWGVGLVARARFKIKMHEVLYAKALPYAIAWGKGRKERAAYGQKVHEILLARAMKFGYAWADGFMARQVWGEKRSVAILARAQLFGESWARGMVCRQRLGPAKSAAIEAGVWSSGGGLLKKRAKRTAAKKSGAANFSKLAASASRVVIPKEAQAAGLTTERLSLALPKAAEAAAAEHPQTEEKRAASKKAQNTRRYIDAEVQAPITACMSKLKSFRPHRSCLKRFITEVMTNPSMDVDSASPAFTKSDDTESSAYSFLKSHGAFILLKPALLAVDEHRPDDPAKFVASFLATMTAELS